MWLNHFAAYLKQKQQCKYTYINIFINGFKIIIKETWKAFMKL